MAARSGASGCSILTCLVVLATLAASAQGIPAYNCTPAGANCCVGSKVTTACPACPAGYGVPSSLWGCRGELAPPANGRLNDWSWAGYRGGEYPIPYPPVIANIKTDFGAVGDNVTDDTAAFVNAFNTIPDGALYIPAGVYRITQQLTCYNRQIVMRGAGQGQTILYFPNSLTDIYGNNFTGGVSDYSYGPSFLYFLGKDFINPDTYLSPITTNAARGTYRLALLNTTNVQVGQWVRITMDDTSTGAMLSDMNSFLSPPDPTVMGKTQISRFVGRVKGVGATTIDLDRALPYNISTAYNPKLYALEPGYQYMGAEYLTVQFKWTVYPGRYKEQGYNAFYFWEAVNSWVRNVTIINADLGIALNYCVFCNVQDVNIYSSPTRASAAIGTDNGFYGITVNRGTDQLITRFNISSKFWHDVSIGNYAYGTVVANGTGQDLTMEISQEAYGTLFSNLNLGAGTRPYGYLVNKNMGASFNTYWNIQANGNIVLPGNASAPVVNVVGIKPTTQTAPASAYMMSVEQPGYSVYPPELYTAQNALRLKTTPPVPLPPPVVPYISPGYGCNKKDNSICCSPPGNATCPPCLSGYGTPSVTFGCNGELWTPAGRLPDWSYAGYDMGVNDIPYPPVAANAKTDYGCKGDGVTDDTQAIINALNGVTWGGVLYFPAGTYVVNNYIDFSRSVIIRGAGQNQTIFYMPRSLTEVDNNPNWTYPSPYANGPFFWTFRGDSKVYTTTRLSNIIANASRGDYVVYVDNVLNITAGDYIRVVQSDPADGSWMKQLLGNCAPPGSAVDGVQYVSKFVTQVLVVGPNYLRLERPLPWMVGLPWTPQIHTYKPWIAGCGVEYVTFRFPLTPYYGHYKEMGYNALALFGVFNSWVRNVTFVNGDLNMALGSSFVTVTNVTVGPDPGGRGPYGDGHYGMTCWTGDDTLIQNFNITGSFIHDISVNGFARNIVYKNGQGLDSNMDHHKSAPFGMLYSNLNLGLGTRPFVSGGEPGGGPRTAAYDTYWNVQSRLALRLPDTDPTDYGSFINFIGMKQNDTIAQACSWFSESPPNIWPQDLHAAMVATRAQRLNLPNTPSGLPLPPADVGPNYGCDASGNMCCWKGSTTATCPLCPAGATVPSLLYGCQGELNTPGDRLPDYSYAGYSAGEIPIPFPPVIGDVKLHFGAKGDNVTDDTNAFLWAIGNISNGAIYIPAGVYRITQQLNIVSKQIVFRGAGKDQTILYFPKSLTQILGNSWTNGVSDFSFGPSFINFYGADPVGSVNFLSAVTGNANRGDTTLKVSSTSAFTLNSWVRLVMDDPASGANIGKLLLDMNGQYTPADPQVRGTANMVRFNSRVVSIGSGTITLDRPLEYNVSTIYNPELYAVTPYQINMGVEYLTMQFMWTTYAGRYKEQGYNAIYFWQGVNSWVREVDIINADVCLVLNYCAWCTVTDVNVYTQAPRGADNGHYALYVNRGTDNLITNLNVIDHYYSDIAISMYAFGTVVNNVTGEDLSLELSDEAYCTLFSNINVGNGSRVYGYIPQPNSPSSYTTYWNIQSNNMFSLPMPTYGPLINFVSMFVSDIFAKSSYAWHLENIPNLYPQDLAPAMKAARLAARPPPVQPAGQAPYTFPSYACYPNGTQCCFTATSTCPACGQKFLAPSALYGCSGERWNTTGALQDWAFAGYNWGTTPIPTAAPTKNAKTDYGAKGDGVTDDTQAIMNAIAGTPSGAVLLIPAGTYILTNRLDFSQSVIIRGAGQNNTILSFTKSVAQINNNTNFTGSSPYSDNPFFIYFRGDNAVYPAHMRATIVANASRGSYFLKVNDTSGITVGTYMRFVMSDIGSGIGKDFLYNQMTPDGPVGQNDIVKWVVKIIAIASNNMVQIQRPLPFNVSTAWNPRIYVFWPGLSNAGIEQLTVKFPLTPYPGISKEQGYNAIGIYGVFQVFVSQVNIINADFGIMVSTNMATIQDVTLSTTGNRDIGYLSGRYGIALWTCGDVLVNRFNIKTKFNWDVSVNTYSTNNVFSNGQAQDLIMDNRGGQPYGTLFSNISAGFGSRMFTTVYAQPDAASYTTWWNIRSTLNTRLPVPNYGTKLNFIGIQSNDTIISPYGWWVENPSDLLTPVDLYTSMNATKVKRLGAAAAT